MRLAILPLLLLPAAAAHASTEDAWTEFRAEVKQACRALVSEEAGVTVKVNPFGSDHFGVAIVTVDGEDGTDRMICIYDKTTHNAELSAPFTQ